MIYFRAISSDSDSWQVTNLLFFFAESRQDFCTEDEDVWGQGVSLSDPSLWLDVPCSLIVEEN